MSTTPIETGSEPRPRMWPIGVWLVILTVVAIAAAIGGRLYQRDQDLKESAQAFAAQELLARHWKSLETQKEFRPVIDAIADDINSDSKSHRWQMRVVMSPAGTGTTLDDFETAAVKQIQAGTEEQWQSSWSGRPRYVRAVRVKESCLPCHQMGPSGTPLKTNDVIAIVSLELAAIRGIVRDYAFDLDFKYEAVAASRVSRN